MTLAVAALLSLGARLAQEADSPLGPKVIQMRNSGYYKSASPRVAADASLGKPLYGDKVTALAVEGRFTRIRLAGGAEVFIASSSLIAEQKFEPNPESEEEKTRLKAQNYKSGRFDSTTENAYIKEKGPKMEGAYKDLDKSMARPDSKADRPKLEAQLTAFRKAGKMGEFASVK